MKNPNQLGALDGLVERACTIGLLLRAQDAQVVDLPPIDVPALQAEAAEVYAHMAEVAERPTAMTVADVQEMELCQGFLDPSILPIRAPIDPTRAVFVVAKDSLTLTSGSRELPIPHRNRTGGSEIGLVGRAVSGCVNLALVKGARPLVAECGAIGISPQMASYGSTHLVGGIHWLTGYVLRRQQAPHSVANFNSMLAHTIVLPTESRARVIRSPGLHPSRWPEGMAIIE